MQKTFRLLLIASAALFGALWFAQWSKIRTLNSGEVHVRPQPQTTAAPPAQPSGDTLPQEITSNAPHTSPPLPDSQPASLPASEPLASNPPNRIVAIGSGKFQLYRQGDLTFRLNTETGQACVLFATDTQWRKPLVYDHGCASR